MKYKGYLIDLDGTMYLGNERIDAAADFIHQLHHRDIPYLFVTNNSSSTAEAVAEKLNMMNIPARPEHVFTSSMATAKYIQNQKPKPRCYVIGEKGLHDALIREGAILSEHDSDFVVFGIDRDITYEKYTKACLAIRNGATFISTNGDTSVPSERGLLPGNGALTSVITISTGLQPVLTGKPEHIIMEEALQVLGTPKDETLMIGDNYDTDIQAGIQAGMDTLLVFTGVTTFEQLTGLKEKPTYLAHSLHEWMDRI